MKCIIPEHELKQNYYEMRNFVSCSTLKDFRDQIRLHSKPDNLQQIFDYGSLVDCLLTEHDRVDHSTQTLHLPHGGDISFSAADWHRACAQRDSILTNPVAGRLMAGSEKQVVIIDDEFSMSYCGYIFTLPVRLKMDGLIERVSMGLDLKTTGSTTQKACEAAIDQFDYDMQLAFYMDVAQLDRFWLLFSTKKANKRGQHDMFPVAVQRGDPWYKSGRRKYQYWAFQYWCMVHGFENRVEAANVV